MRIFPLLLSFLVVITASFELIHIQVVNKKTNPNPRCRVKILKRSSLKLLIISTFFSVHSNASFMKILDNVMVTINPNAKISGPIYRHYKKKEDQYGDRLLKILLKEADAKAKRYLKEGNIQAYNAFLILALTVPNQEGLMVHFREVKANKSYCRDKRTLGKTIISSKARSYFQKTLAWKSKFLMPCYKMPRSSTYRQLIAGGRDGSDVGIMQLSSRWHYEDFLKPAKYASVEETVRYGVGYIFNDYNRNLMKPKSCILKLNRKVNYHSLIRGSWSAYNGGPDSFCRFANRYSDYAKKDKHFNTSLDKTLSFSQSKLFGFSQDGKLPLTKKAENALLEVISNYKIGRLNRIAFNTFMQ